MQPNRSRLRPDAAGEAYTAAPERPVGWGVCNVVPRHRPRRPLFLPEHWMQLVALTVFINRVVRLEECSVRRALDKLLACVRVISRRNFNELVYEAIGVVG